MHHTAFMITGKLKDKLGTKGLEMVKKKMKKIKYIELKEKRVSKAFGLEVLQ